MSRSGSHTVRSWVKMWYEVYAEPRLREKTKDYYLNYIDKHIIPELGDIKLDKLTTIQIQQFYNNLQKNGRVQRYKHIELKNKGLSVRVVHGIHQLSGTGSGGAADPGEPRKGMQAAEDREAENEGPAGR